MAIELYLAQTAAEFASCSQKPAHMAWMACHFSPYATGITNLPPSLPEGALLILNDRTPVCGHDPKTVCKALLDTANRFRCCAILLDFQHPGCEQIAKEAAKLPFSVAITEEYAKTLDCAVFLSAPALHKPLSEHIAPWKDRKIWLEAATDCTRISVTEKGAVICRADPPSDEVFPFYDDTLHCKYRTEITDNSIHFTLRRDKKELYALLAEAETLGIDRAIGLYQQLR